jgi:hypothetical protein
LAVANVNEAWSAFYETTRVESEEELAELGWKSIRAIASESKLTIASVSCRVETAVGKGMLESKKATIRTAQGVREVKFFRPT